MMSMGVAAYLNKPIIMRELLYELRRHIVLPAAPRGPLAADTAVRLGAPV